ncbi:MAG: glycosyltransferase family 4 protein [Candidatus Buchananbacteria bacterium]
MKVLIVNDEFYPEKVFGPSVIAYNIAKDLQKRGNEVMVFSSILTPDAPKEIIFDGLKIYRIISTYNRRYRNYYNVFNRPVVKEFRRVLDQFRPDVVHFHNTHDGLCYCLFKTAKKFGAKTFLTAHDVMLFVPGKLIEFIDKNDYSVKNEYNYRVTLWQQLKRFKKRFNPFRNLLIRYYLGYVDKIFAVSNELADALKQNKISNVAVIHNGIDLTGWQIDSGLIAGFKEKYRLAGKPVVLYAGRLSPLKGGRVIIEVMKKVREQITDAALLIVGKSEEYFGLTKSEKDKNWLICTDWISGQELRLAYLSSDLVVVPSVCFDCFPTVNLEAMAAAKPVIATCFGGSGEAVVDNVTGFIINPLDIKTTAEKVVSLLEDKNLAAKFGQAGFERVKEKFSLARQVETILKYYQS